MIKWLRENWRSLVWALALSLSVWIAAVTSADPDEQHAYEKPVIVEIVGQDPGLVILGEVPASVEVTLRAPQSVWNKINAQETPLRAALDLSGLGAGEHSIPLQVQITEPLQVQITERLVRIVGKSPSTFQITLEPLVSRFFPLDITLNGQPAIGFQAGEPILDPLRVRVSGAQSLVDRVSRVRVVININGTREGIDQAIEVQVLDENNQLLQGLSVSPSNAQVTLPVSQQGGYRDVAVKVVIKGQVASGYLLNNLSVFPPVVTVYSADPALVNALPGVVETEPLDLRGASEGLSTRLALKLPEGVSVVGEQNVQVVVGIAPIQSNLTLSKIRIEIVGLDAGVSAQVSPTEVDVILSGPAPLLDSLLLQDVRVIVDISGLGPGTYQLTPKVEILVADVVVESVLPNTVEVVITVASPTPGP